MKSKSPFTKWLISWHYNSESDYFVYPLFWLPEIWNWYQLLDNLEQPIFSCHLILKESLEQPISFCHLIPKKSYFLESAKELICNYILHNSTKALTRRHLCNLPCRTWRQGSVWHWYELGGVFLQKCTSTNSALRNENPKHERHFFAWLKCAWNNQVLAEFQTKSPTDTSLL